MEKDLEENIEEKSSSTNEVNDNVLNELKEKLQAQRAELDEKEDRLKRLMAEFDNFKKRSAKEREGLCNSLVSDSVQTEDNNYKIGVELVLKQFKDVLKSNGINEIETVGKTFDPELHEAVSSVEDDSLGVQEIKEEYRKGYMIGNKVIRHSLVVVAN